MLLKQADDIWSLLIYSNPTPKGSQDDLLKINWDPSGISGRQLDINRDLRMHPRLSNSRARFFGILMRNNAEVSTACADPKKSRIELPFVNTR